MKKYFVFILLIGLFSTVQAQRPNAPKFNTIGEPVRIFNGEDLTGWQVYGTEKWYVDEKGYLVCESGPDKEYGYLATQQLYKDFELKLEFKQEENGNSGVFFHSAIEGTRISGWQAEVAPKGNFTGGIYESYGRGWLVKPTPDKDKYLKEGEWNKMRIRVIEDRVTVWLNGKEMIWLKDKLIGKHGGSVALQIHSGGGIKVRWRNIYLQKLSSKGTEIFEKE